MKVAKVCNMSRTVAIEIYLKFKHALFEENKYYVLSGCTASLIVKLIAY